MSVSRYSNAQPCIFAYTVCPLSLFALNRRLPAIPGHPAPPVLSHLIYPFDPIMSKICLEARVFLPSPPCDSAKNTPGVRRTDGGSLLRSHAAPPVSA